MIRLIVSLVAIDFTTASYNPHWRKNPITEKRKEVCSQMTKAKKLAGLLLAALLVLTMGPTAYAVTRVLLLFLPLILLQLIRRLDQQSLISGDLRLRIPDLLHRLLPTIRLILSPRFRFRICGVMWPLFLRWRVC